MTNPLIKIYNADTDETIEREMNAKEFAEHIKFLNDVKKSKAEIEAREIAKLAILERLGLTADELQTILG